MQPEGGGLPRRYWDWGSRRGDQPYMWFCGTPPVSMLFGLRELLTMLFEEGLPAVFARHRRLAEAARRAVGPLGRSRCARLLRAGALRALRCGDGDCLCRRP